MGKHTSENIKFLRSKMGMKQVFLAELLDLDASTIWGWESKKYPVPDGRLYQICEIFNNYLKSELGELTPDRLKFEDLSLAEKPSAKERVVNREPNQMTEGLQQLIDSKEFSLMGVTEEELKVLQGIVFRHFFRPSKQFYIDALFDYRKSKEEES